MCEVGVMIPCSLGCFEAEMWQHVQRISALYLAQEVFNEWQPLILIAIVLLYQALWCIPKFPPTSVLGGHFSNSAYPYPSNKIDKVPPSGVGILLALTKCCWLFKAQPSLNPIPSHTATFSCSELPYSFYILLLCFLLLSLSSVITQSHLLHYNHIRD